MDYNAPMTEETLRDLRRRTAARLMQARVEMQSQWLLHPANATARAFDIAAPFRQLAEALKHISFSQFKQPPYNLEGFKPQAVGREMRL